VVGAADDQDASLPRVCPCQPECQVICLAAAVDPEHDAQLPRQRLSQLLRRGQQRGVQIPAVGVQRPQLRAHGSNHLRVAVADVAHVVDAVQVLTPLLVVQELRLATHHVQWCLAIVQRHVAADHLLAGRHQGSQFHGRGSVGRERYPWWVGGCGGGAEGWGKSHRPAAFTL
jgi:hypothetical protein